MSISLEFESRLADGTLVRAEIHSEDGLEAVHAGSTDLTSGISMSDRRALREEGFRLLDEERAKQELDRELSERGIA